MTSDKAVSTSVMFNMKYLIRPLVSFLLGGIHLRINEVVVTMSVLDDMNVGGAYGAI